MSDVTTHHSNTLLDYVRRVILRVHLSFVPMFKLIRTWLSGIQTSRLSDIHLVHESRIDSVWVLEKAYALG